MFSHNEVACLLFNPDDGGRILSQNVGDILSRLHDVIPEDSKVKKEKVKLSLYRPSRPIGLREVEAPTFSKQSAH
jgi:hypothetical protein